MDDQSSTNLDIETFPELIKSNVYEAYTSYYNTIERADGTTLNFPLWLLLTLIIITIFVGLWLWWSIGGYKKKSKFITGINFH